MRMEWKLLFERKKASRDHSEGGAGASRKNASMMLRCTIHANALERLT
jgi:hypothetical protein